MVIVPKQVDIAASLRRLIRSGKYKPGSRLPTVRELTASTGAGLPTVHRAITTLVDQGFISTDGRNGTHVVDHPPHRCRFGLVMPERPDDTGHYAYRLPQAMAEAAATINRPGRRIVIHHGINQHPELPEHRLLAQELAAGMLAGLVILDLFRISAWISDVLAGVPLIAAPETDVAVTACFSLDQEQVLLRGLDAIVTAGRTRPAFLGVANANSLRYLPTLREGARQRGLQMHPSRIRAISVDCPSWAAQAVASLWDRNAGDTPDALLILDDNLVDEAVSGLHAIGAENVLIVHLTNFPSTPADWRPLVRIGWDQGEVLGLSLDRLANSTGKRKDALGDIVAPLRIESLTDGR